MAGLSKSEYIHFLLEKLSLDSNKASSQADTTWTVDEEKFALKHGQSTFPLEGSYVKLGEMKDKADCDKHITQVAETIRSVASAPSKGLDSPFEDIKNHIYPRLREKEYVDYVNAEAKGDAKMIFHQTNILPSTLCVVFILDISSKLSPEITQKQLSQWKVTEVELFEISLANLRKITPPTLQWTKADGGFELLGLEDAHVAARCLLSDLFTGEKPKDALAGDMVIIIPADGRLVATFAMDQLGLCFLGDTLLDYEEDEDAEDTITQQALRLQPGGSGQPVPRWAPFEPRANEGRIPTDEKDVDMLFNAISMAAKKFAADQLGVTTTSDQAQEPSCAVCEARGVNLMKCSRCLSVSYCSRDCQKKDWPKHKATCKKL